MSNPASESARMRAGWTNAIRGSRVIHYRTWISLLLLVGLVVGQDQTTRISGVRTSDVTEVTRPPDASDRVDISRSEGKQTAGVDLNVETSRLSYSTDLPPQGTTQKADRLSVDSSSNPRITLPQKDTDSTIKDDTGSSRNTDSIIISSKSPEENKSRTLPSDAVSVTPVAPDDVSTGRNDQGGVTTATKETTEVDIGKNRVTGPLHYTQ